MNIRKHNKGWLKILGSPAVGPRLSLKRQTNEAASS